jgi:hypothetical protein
MVVALPARTQDIRQLHSSRNDSTNLVLLKSISDPDRISARSKISCTKPEHRICQSRTPNLLLNVKTAPRSSSAIKCRIYQGGSLAL